MFKPATKVQSKLRLALYGPSGSGKTYTALRIAKGLGGRLAVIDTERGSASKYAGDLVSFDVLELDSFAPATYVQAIQAADALGYEVLVIDSLSHAWMGKDGALEQVDRAAKRSSSGSSFNAWREVTPMHNALVEAILQSRCHIIVTMRSKTEYVLETNERGRQAPRKVGLAPVQRDGLEYEFDVVAALDDEHNLVVHKTRCAALDRLVVQHAGEEVGQRLRAWLSDGAVQPPSLADELVAELAQVRDEPALERARERARELKERLSRADQERVGAAIGAAKRLVKEAHEAATAAGTVEQPATSGQEAQA